MALEVGKSYYLVAHAYHHFIGECVEVYGPNRGRFTKLIRVQSCKRGWTEFFRDGIFGTEDTVYSHWPDGDITCMIGPFDWNHPIPEPPEAYRGRKIR